MRERVRVECAWFLALADGPGRGRARHAAGARRATGRERSPHDPARDRRGRHQADRGAHQARREGGRISGSAASSSARGAAAAQLEWVHFACTSEDINNLAYALMLKRARDIAAPAHARRPSARSLDSLAQRYAATPACWRARMARPRRPPPSARNSPMSPRASSASARASRASTILGKMNGAVGNFNAHVGGAAAGRLAGLQRARSSNRSASSRIRLHHADRAARLDRRVLPRAAARQHRAPRFRARHVELHLARLFQAEAGRRAKSAPPPCRTRSIRSTSRMPRAISGSRTPCSRISPRSCPCRGCSAISRDSTVLRNLGVAIGHCGPRLSIARGGALARSSSTRRGSARIWTAPGRCWARRCKR